MKAAQVFQRMWIQAVKKLERWKDHVSPWAFALLSHAFSAGGEGGKPFLTQWHTDSFILGFICVLAAFRNKLVRLHAECGLQSVVEF